MSETRTLANGAKQDIATGRIVAGAVLTRDRAREMVRAREAKRMRLYAEGAQLAVEDAKLLQDYGQDAHIVERAMTLQRIASTPDAGKAAVMADTALQRAQGYDIKPEPVAVAQTDMRPDVILALLAIVGDSTDAGADVLEAEALDVE